MVDAADGTSTPRPWSALNVETSKNAHASWIVPVRARVPFAASRTNASTTVKGDGDRAPRQPMPRPVIRPLKVSPKQMNAANANGTQGWLGFAPGSVFWRSRASACAMIKIRIGPNP